METSTLFFAAVQTSFLLGLLHGINPCGHSWLVLAPFVSGERKSRRVAGLTLSFVSGTILACLLLGVTIGAVSKFLPPILAPIIEIATAAILCILGILLIYDPHLLHNHDHDEEEHSGDPHCHGTETEQTGDHGSSACCCSHPKKSSLTGRLRTMTKNQTLLAPALFLIGFFNMIIPCPTAAIMYTYAINSGSPLHGVAVFGVYALSTAVSVSIVVTLIFLITNMAGKLQKKWIEPLIMRFAGVVLIVFSAFELHHFFHG